MSRLVRLIAQLGNRVMVVQCLLRAGVEDETQVVFVTYRYRKWVDLKEESGWVAR